jgi:putative tricarboxylic transport membrane protein
LHWSFVTGVGVSVGIYTIFHLVLGLSLAKGPFGF